MTLKEFKLKVLRLIEEVSDTNVNLTDDPDISAKLNDVINSVLFEVSRFKKIPCKTTIEVTEENRSLDLTSLPNFYQNDNVRFYDEDGYESEYDLFGTFVEFRENGRADIYYWMYPVRITDTSEDDTYIFEVSDDALEVAIYGVAADLLKSDISNQYGQIYSQRYETMLQRLDPRYNTGTIYIELAVGGDF